MILTTAAWVATAAILLTYALTTRKGKGLRSQQKTVERFHYANAFGCVPLALLNAQAGVWPAVVVNLGFGLPAALAVYRDQRRRQTGRADRRLGRLLRDQFIRVTHEAQQAAVRRHNAEVDRLYPAAPDPWEADLGS